MLPLSYSMCCKQLHHSTWAVTPYSMIYQQQVMKDDQSASHVRFIEIGLKWTNKVLVTSFHVWTSSCSSLKTYPDTEPHAVQEGLSVIIVLLKCPAIERLAWVGKLEPWLSAPTVLGQRWMGLLWIISNITPPSSGRGGNSCQADGIAEVETRGRDGDEGIIGTKTSYLVVREILIPDVCINYLLEQFVLCWILSPLVDGHTTGHSNFQFHYV